MASPPQLAALLEEIRLAVDGELDRWLPPADESPVRLHEAMRYAVFAGGKRLRPALAIVTARGFGVPDRDVLPPAASLELVHTYSLIHDDLPCMDDDDLRRGLPTCHKKFGEAVAVLAGDALLTLAFEVIASFDANAGVRAELGRVLARAAGSRGMVAGQVLDLEGEGAPPTASRVEAIHRRKTAALLGASVVMGVVAARADRDLWARYQAFGENLGLAFQIVDDILDLEGTSEKLGKTPGKDVAQEKLTYPAAVGVEAARLEARRLTEKAKGCIDGLPAQDTLAAIAVRLLNRIA
ncbi:MAG: polyprenyl synthetase family protein [Planctomycetota bacterium]